MKRTVEEWLTADFAIEKEQRQKVGPDGPLFNPDGTPDLLDMTILILIHTGADGQEILRIPFSDEAKHKLMQQLSGGIILPGLNGPLL